MVIFSFWSFEISKGILRNQKFIIGLDSFSKQCSIYLAHLEKTSPYIDYPVERCKLSYSLWPYVAKFKGSLMRLEWPKPRYGPSLFSLICSLLLKDLSFNLCPIPDLYPLSGLLPTRSLIRTHNYLRSPIFSHTFSDLYPREFLFSDLYPRFFLSVPIILIHSQISDGCFVDKSDIAAAMVI